MSEPLILMTKQLSEPLRNSAVRQPGRTTDSAEFRRGRVNWTTEVTEGHRGLFLGLCASLCALWSIPAFAQPVWEQLPPLPEPNGGFVCGHQDGKIVLIGGTNWKDGKKHWLSKRHTFDPANKSWNTDPKVDVTVAYAVSMQSERGFSFACGFDGTKARRIPTGVLAAGGKVSRYQVIVGGTNDPANISGLCRDVWILSKNDRRAADYPGKPVATAASTAVGSELFVFGGMNCDSGSKTPLNTDEAYAFTPMRNTWRTLKVLPWRARGLSAVTLDENHIYIAGGYREDFTAEAVIYEVKADSYRKAPSLPYAAMVGLVKMGEHVYCLGGEDKKQSRTDKFFRLPVAELLK